MSESLHLDPEAEALLREIAADPRSSLLRVERARKPLALLERRSRVGSGAAGLSAAERHLLDVHRHEVAWLAKEACKWRLVNDEQSRLYLSRSLGPGRETPILTREELEGRARELREHETPQAALPALLALLERCVRGPEGGRPTVIDLALAALRLEEVESTRICLGYGLVLLGEARAALGALDPGRLSSWDHEGAPYALICIGFAYTHLSEARASLSAYRRASLLTDGPTFSDGFCALLGARLGDRRTVISALAKLDSAEGRPVFAEFLACIGSQRHGKGWSVTPDEVRLLRALQGCSGVAQELADALA